MSRLGQVRVSLGGLVGILIFAVLVVIAVMARGQIAERIPLSPPILVAVTVALGWIAYLAWLRDSNDPAPIGGDAIKTERDVRDER